MGRRKREEDGVKVRFSEFVRFAGAISILAALLVFALAIIFRWDTADQAKEALVGSALFALFLALLSLATANVGGVAKGPIRYFTGVLLYALLAAFGFAVAYQQTGGLVDSGGAPVDRLSDAWFYSLSRLVPFTRDAGAMAATTAWGITLSYVETLIGLVVIGVLINTLSQYVQLPQREAKAQSRKP